MTTQPQVPDELRRELIARGLDAIFSGIEATGGSDRDVLIVLTSMLGAGYERLLRDGLDRFMIETEIAGMTALLWQQNPPFDHKALADLIAAAPVKTKQTERAKAAQAILDILLAVVECTDSPGEGMAILAIVATTMILGVERLGMPSDDAIARLNQDIAKAVAQYKAKQPLYQNPQGSA